MISIVTANITGGLNYLVNLVPTIERQKIPHEFILVDNASKDGSLNYMANHESVIKVNTFKKSFSQSNNEGSKIATGDYLLFLNNDTKLEENTLEEMLNTFEVDEKIGIVGCQIRLMTPPYKIQHAGVMFTDKYEPYELGLSQPFGIPELLSNDPRARDVREVPAVTACCMMIKKSVFEKLGMFDENYKNGWEDVDLNLKAREVGYKIYYTGKTCIYHHRFGSKDRGRFDKEKENRDYYESVWMNTGRAGKVLGNFREA